MTRNFKERSTQIDCHHKVAPMIPSAFTGELEKAGYFNGLPEKDAQSLKDSFNRQGWQGIFAESHRLYPADAEDLAEGGVGNFIREVQPFLSTQGVRAVEIVDDVSNDGYIVHVNDKACQIYDAEELRQDNDREKPGHIWGLAMTRGFKIVNDLLAAAGSREQVYAINGGNDLMALFLTPEQCRVIMSHPDASPKGGPYQPTEEFPWYGEPQQEEDSRTMTGSYRLPVKPGVGQWRLWKKMLAAFLLGCVLLGLKLLLFGK